MEIYNIFLADLDITVPVIVERKKMKNCRLRVLPDKSAKISVPKNTPAGWIENFLQDKSGWLSQKIQAFNQAKGQVIRQLKNGDTVSFLGRKIIVKILPAGQSQVYKDDKNLYIFTADILDQEKIFSQFDCWWRRESLKLLNTEVDRFLPIVEKYNVARPGIRLRKMKTLWGSVNVLWKVITFNQYLTMAPLFCVDYVVLHELTHLIYPNHGKEFYSFLNRHMPDWKIRKKELDYYFLH